MFQEFCNVRVKWFELSNISSQFVNNFRNTEELFVPNAYLVLILICSAESIKERVFDEKDPSNIVESIL